MRIDGCEWNCDRTFHKVKYRDLVCFSQALKRPRKAWGGPRGRRFKSCIPDSNHIQLAPINWGELFRLVLNGLRVCDRFRTKFKKGIEIILRSRIFLTLDFSGICSGLIRSPISWVPSLSEKYHSSFHDVLEPTRFLLTQ